MLKASKNLSNPGFIVATDAGIIYQMQKESPGKYFLEAPTGGEGAMCRSCARCPWMGMNDLNGILSCFKNNNNLIKNIDKNLLDRAKKSLGRMVDFRF